MFFKKRTPLRRLSDEELLAQYRESQERELVGELFGRHAELIFLVCMKYLKDSEEAKDASMGVFEKLLNDLHRYEVRNFKFWLHTVSKNHCIALLEKRRRLPTESLQRPEQLHSLVESEQETALWKELEKRPGALEHLDAAIGTLNPEQRDCIRLFYLEQKSYKEVAEQTGFSMLQVKSFIQNGKRNLRIQLEKRGLRAEDL